MQTRHTLLNTLSAMLVVALFAFGCGHETTPTDDNEDTLSGNGLPKGDSGSQANTIKNNKVTISTNKASYQIGENVHVKIFNGSKEVIFLEGCNPFVGEHDEQGTFIPSPFHYCIWEGLAVQVKPGETVEETRQFQTAGTWRLALRFGTGCLADKPLSGAQCTSFDTVYSKSIQVTPVGATSLTLKYQQEGGFFAYKLALDLDAKMILSLEKELPKKESCTLKLSSQQVFELITSYLKISQPVEADYSPDNPTACCDQREYRLNVHYQGPNGPSSIKTRYLSEDFSNNSNMPKALQNFDEALNKLITLTEQQGACTTPARAATISTDKTDYKVGEEFKVTIFNGLGESIFLEGCNPIFGERLEGNTWQPYVYKTCFWEGLAVEVKPGEKVTETFSFFNSGTWRLAMNYGTGCTPGKPLSGAQCSSFTKAFSSSVMVNP